MFSWNFAKSAEAVLSRLAVKRLCKFVLKKKLGQFILGDIDLDQLDVQISEGTIQLSDLALNVDCLNEKFGVAASVMIKEGSIGSLSVKMPWMGKGFQVELDELELVLAPCLKKSNTPTGDETGSCSQDSRHRQKGVGKFGNDLMENAAKSSHVDVHEGVKTIAKMVKWFLTSFHVKVKKLIVAFEPYFEKDEKKVGCQETLVLRVSEIECGTCVSEDPNSSSDHGVENFLGISHLMNLVEFQGAVLELLQTDGVSDSSFSEQFFGHCRSNPTTPILTGKKGGFSGNLKLSIPWKNGSLDIHKLDAELCLDPIELRLQPSKIKWFLLSWETCKHIDKDGGGDAHYRSTESVCFNSSSHFHSSLTSPTAFAIDNSIPVHGSFTSAISSFTGKESVSEAMLSGSHLISDWVPNSIENEKDGIQEELDLGASVDQFFECLDGMRSSQSALGSSGMWNWTCSVFSALTAASSLAAGSFHIPFEDQHVQTNLKATLAGISILLSFQDDDQEDLYGQKSDQNTVDLEVHCLGAECKDIFVVLQVCPQEKRFEGTVKSIEVADYLYNKNDAMNLHLHDYSSDSNSGTVLIKNLQAEVQGALPPFPYLDESSTLVVPGVPSGNATKVKLLGTSGVTRCQFTVSSNSSDKRFTGTKSFSVQLPLLIFWVNYGSVNMILSLLKDAEKSVEMSAQRSGFPSVNKKCEFSHGNMKKGSSSGVSTLTCTENLQGSISIPCARVILCFPFASGGDVGGHSSWNQFIAFDISSPLTLEEGKVLENSLTLNSCSRKRQPPRVTGSLHLNVGNLEVYLVNPACKNDGISSSTVTPRRKFCAQKIVSVSNRAGSLCAIKMLWQEDPVTGPSIAEIANSLPTPESRRKFMVKGYEFASATAVKDLGDLNSRTREKIILSSAFFFHVHLFSVMVDVSSSQYSNLHCLLDQMINGLPGMACDAVSVGELPSVSPTSILVECESVDFSIRPDTKDDIKSSLQSELPGSWHYLKLKIRKFDMLSASNIGGIRGANFFWLAHGEGKLWGSITGVPDREFLLISCSNSTMKRGDGGGSNALSSMLAGSEIIHVWDPESSRDFTSVTVRCATIIAVGGRLDWLDAISSFFTLPSPEVEKASDESLSKGGLNAPSGTSFILKLVDIGISYEPHLKNSVIGALHSETGSLYSKEETGEPHVACLLAASLFSLSNTTMEDSIDSDYKIRVQDVGLLLGAAHDHGGTYSVEYLHKMGYAKVAHEALFEAILRTDCKNGLLWELECSKSHIYVETCHDTTYGLIRLAAQFQELFAPDLEESVVHLQNRWNSVRQAQERNKLNDEGGISNHDCVPSTSQVHTPTADTKSKLGVAGLMDEICEDAFHLHGTQACQLDSYGSEIHVSPDESLLGEACSLSVETPDFFLEDLSYDGSVPLAGLESSQTTFLQSGSFPEFIEGYYLPDLCPSPELSIGRQTPSEKLKCKSKNFDDADHGRGNGGWYGDAPLSIFENHISGASGEASVNQVLEDQLPTMYSDDFGKATGRVLFKNINVSWRMYAGSDWQVHKRNGDPSSHTCGRETTVYLELALSGMRFQYDVFPVGGIYASKLCLSVQDFHLYDGSKTAPWKRILGYYHSKDHPRESTSKAFKLDLEAVRPDPLIPLEEYRLRIALLPVLLHLHQSQLDFLISFFGPKSLSAGQSSDQDQNSDGAKTSATNSSNLAGHTIANEALLPFFQKFDIWPIILRIDYSPHHVDLAALSSGKYVELVNLVPWKGVELQLKHVHAVGVYGWGSVCETIIGEWLVEISQNQIHKILQGLPTIRSFVAVGSSAAKLVSLPVESYRKDHKIIKGMQRGTFAFLKRISLEAVGLGVHLAAGAHDILLQAECILTGVPSAPLSWSLPGKTKANVRCNQPKDAQQGIQHAYESLSDGLGKSASALVRTPFKKYQLGASAGSALATAVQAVPAAAIAPVSACAGAAHYALLGLRNSLDPEHKKESMEKYLGSTKPND